MSTIDTSTWSPDSSLNTDIGGIPLNADASIQQTWQAIQMLMAALKGDTSEIKLTINQPDGTTIVATNQTLTVVDDGHAHTIANVAGLQTALDAKASTAGMTGATASADGASGLVPAPSAGDQDKMLKGDGTWGTAAASSVAWSDVTGKPSTFTPASHAHGNVSNAGAIGSTSGLPVVTGTDGVLQAGSFGTTAGTVCEGSDSRLSDARTPITHTHAGTEVSLTGYSKPSSTSAVDPSDTVDAAIGKLEKALDGKQASGSYAAAAHTHDAGDVTSGVLPVANGGTGSSTQNFVDLTTEQTVKGMKTLYGTEMDNHPEFSKNYNHSIFLRMLSRRDTLNSSCAYLKRYRQNTSQGATGSNSLSIGLQENTYYTAALNVGAVYTVSGSNVDLRFYIGPEIVVSNTDGITFASVKDIGASNNAWDNVYANSGPWSASDARLKDGVEDPSPALLKAWGKVGFKVFQMKDAKARKGEGARFHVGVVAQDVAEAFASEGLDAGRYGLYGYDKWEDNIEDGVLMQKAGDKYSIRYEEALALECAYQREKIRSLEARVAELEKLVAMKGGAQ